MRTIEIGSDTIWETDRRSRFIPLGDRISALSAETIRVDLDDFFR